MMNYITLFDRDDIPKSFKSTTWWFLPCGIAYHSTDTTNISNVPLKILLSHTATKDELTVFWSKELLEFSKESKLYTVAWQNKAEASHMDGMLTISAEVKKKLILHVVDASQMDIFFHWMQMYLFFASLSRRYPEFPRETIFVTGTGNRQRKINLGQFI